MLKALKEFGSICGKVTIYDEIQADYIVSINFDRDGNYTGAELHKFDSSKISLYLYRKSGNAMIPAYSLTVRANDAEKGIKRQKRILKKIRNYISVQPFDFDKKEKLPVILKDVEEIFKNRKKGEEWLLTIRFDGKWPGEIETFRKATEMLIREKGGRNKREGICSVCGEKKTVSTKNSPFKFSTVDKPGVIPGFKEEFAYKVFPLCVECSELIRHAKKFIEKNLQFTFVDDIRYMLIPDFIIGKEAVRKEVLEILTAGRDRMHTLTSQEVNRITEDQEEILEILSQERDVMTFHFLFISSDHKKNSKNKKDTNRRELIDLYIQDVYPSRLQHLFKAKKTVDRIMNMGNHSLNGYDFSYKKLYHLFKVDIPTERGIKTVKIFPLMFYEIIDKTFKGMPISEDYLVSFLMLKIRDEAKKDRKKCIYTIRDAFATLLFIKFTTKEVDMDNGIGEKEKKKGDGNNTLLDSYLNSLFILKNDLRKGIFLLGVLTQDLIKIQEDRNDGRAPIWKSLKGLKMSSFDFQKLLPLLRSKLEEYDSFSKKERILFENISYYLARSQVPWDSYDQAGFLNFCFALGMGLYYETINNLFPQKEENLLKEVGHDSE